MLRVRGGSHRSKRTDSRLLRCVSLWDRFLVYPQCLDFLELLQVSSAPPPRAASPHPLLGSQTEGFRSQLAFPGVVELIEKQQELAWRKDVVCGAPPLTTGQEEPRTDSAAP